MPDTPLSDLRDGAFCCTSGRLCCRPRPTSPRLPRTPDFSGLVTSIRQRPRHSGDLSNPTSKATWLALVATLLAALPAQALVEGDRHQLYAQHRVFGRAIVTVAVRAAASTE